MPRAIVTGSGKKSLAMIPATRTGIVARNHLSCSRTTSPDRRQRSTTLALTAARTISPDPTARSRITANTGSAAGIG
jgi:hypothetical protein